MTLTLGQRLHIARESKGLSLQDVSHTTRIPVPRLRDLEEDTYTSFGSLTYTKNFLKDYSKLLEVDASEVLDQMHAPALGGARDYQYLLKNYGTWTRRSPSRPSSSYDSAPSMARSGSMGVMAGICAALLVFGMGMLLGAAFLGGEHKPAPQAQTDQEVTRRAEPAPQPETHVVPFSTPAPDLQSLPASPAPTQAARPVSADKKDAKGEAPFKRPNLAPGVIPKALPVEEPKAKSKR
jgi:cytoskeletal protein RodZ